MFVVDVVDEGGEGKIFLTLPNTQSFLSDDDGDDERDELNSEKLMRP